MPFLVKKLCRGTDLTIWRPGEWTEVPQSCHPIFSLVQFSYQLARTGELISKWTLKIPWKEICCNTLEYFTQRSVSNSLSIISSCKQAVKGILSSKCSVAGPLLFVRGSASPTAKVNVMLKCSFLSGMRIWEMFSAIFCINVQICILYDRAHYFHRLYNSEVNIHTAFFMPSWKSK